MSCVAESTSINKHADLWTAEEDAILTREFARGAPDSYIADKLQRSRHTVKARRMAIGLRRRCGSCNTPTKYTPTPAEIRAECEKIQATWDDAERAKRAGMRGVEFVIPSQGKEWIT